MAAVVPARMLVLVALANPIVANEVHGLAAGVVATAIGAPVLLMRRRYVEIDRRPLADVAPLLDDHRLLHVQRGRRHVADVDPAIDTGLVDADRNADVRLRKGRADGAHGKYRDENLLHGGSPEWSDVDSTTRRRPEGMSKVPSACRT